MGTPNSLAFIALVGYIPATFAAFLLLGPRAAMLGTLVGGWLLLPAFDAFGTAIPLLHSKASFVPGVVLVSSLLLDGGRWRSLRFRPLDLPVLVVCLAPAAASLANALGPYDAMAAAFRSAVTWAAPFLLGRAYLREPADLTEAAAGLASAGLVYVPLCLWEVRMSPQLHRAVYGFYPFGTDFTQVMRFGGYRPSVFMADGLMTAMFMAVAALSAYWLWRTRARAAVAGVPIGWACAVLGATVLLTKSTGAIALLAAGFAVLEGSGLLRSGVLVVCLAAVPPAYVAARSTGWTGSQLIELSGSLVDPARAASIRFRMDNEDMLVAKALQRPWLGWGGWGRSRIHDDEGRDVSITDGLWVIALGTTGLVGLVALWAFLVLPPLLLFSRFPVRHWAHPGLSGAVALATILLLWVVDDLLNAMVTPVFPVLSGGLASLALGARRRQPRRGPVARGLPAPRSTRAMGGGTA